MKIRPIARIGSVIVLLYVFAAAPSYASPCDDNFSASGSIFTGKTYKTWADLPNVKFENAFKGAYLYTVKDGWKILQSDKEMGVIQAAQAASYAKGKTVPLNITVEKSDAGSKISMSFSTPLGMISPEDAVKSHFCKTIEAAGANQSGGNRAEVSESAPQRANKSDASSTDHDAAAKSTLPCVAEICLGDGLDKLAKVKWERAHSSLSFDNKVHYISTNKVNENQIDFLKQTYRGEIEKSAPYLLSNIFDSQALQGLASIKASCAPAKLVGHYVSSSGNPTDVYISMLPDLNDSAIQKWTVVYIQRKLPGVVTAAQLKEAKKQLDEKYADFDITHRKGKLKTGLGEYFMTNGAGAGFALEYFVDIMDNADRLKQHPLCGGTEKVKID